MAYTKKTWVSGETPLSAENMNHIEQGVADAHNDISSLNTKIPVIQSGSNSFTLEAGAYTNVNISFDTAYSSVPLISLHKADYGTLFDIYNVGYNRYSVYFYVKNTSSNKITGKINWQAIGV